MYGLLIKISELNSLLRGGEGIIKGGEMNYTNWTFMFTFGYSLDVYAYGSLRVAIDTKTGKQILAYVSKGGK